MALPCSVLLYQVCVCVCVCVCKCVVCMCVCVCVCVYVCVYLCVCERKILLHCLSFKPLTVTALYCVGRRVCHFEYQVPHISLDA